jgi:hypothetical protein
MGQLTGAERNRKEAAKFSDLSKTAASPFLRNYYSHIAERYLSLESDWTLRANDRETSES